MTETLISDENIHLRRASPRWIFFSVALAVGAFTAAAQKPAGFWAFVFKPWFALLIIFVIIAGVILEMRRVKIVGKKDMEISAERKQHDRVRDYYGEYVYNYTIGKDLRIYNLAPMLEAEMKALHEDFVRRLSRTWRVTLKYDILGGALSTFINFLAYGFVAVKAVFGAFPVGGVVQYIGAVTRFSEGLRLFIFYFQGVLISIDSLSLYFDFLDMKDNMKTGTLHISAIPACRYICRECTRIFGARSV